MLLVLTGMLNTIVALLGEVDSIQTPCHELLAVHRGKVPHRQHCAPASPIASFGCPISIDIFCTMRQTLQAKMLSCLLFIELLLPTLMLIPLYISPQEFVQPMPLCRFNSTALGSNIVTPHCSSRSDLMALASAHQICLSEAGADASNTKPQHEAINLPHIWASSLLITYDGTACMAMLTSWPTAIQFAEKVRHLSCHARIPQSASTCAARPSTMQHYTVMPATFHLIAHLSIALNLGLSGLVDAACAYACACLASPKHYCLCICLLYMTSYALRVARRCSTQSFNALLNIGENGGVTHDLLPWHLHVPLWLSSSSTFLLGIYGSCSSRLWQLWQWGHFLT